MKKKQLANCIMVLIILVMVAAGVLIAWHFYAPQQSLYGGQFHPKAIPNNRLVTDETTENLCTITIRCDTVFQNEAALEKEKAPYIPADGVILPVTTVEFAPGETVFQVLQRVCEESGIRLEYSWTPLYDSYYIEGISHLYEFDCGFQSGWMYKVNGTFPNYGCSAYTLQGGEEIVWCYTCEGLGLDVGAEKAVSQ